MKYYLISHLKFRGRENIYLVGNNGSGKTMLMKCVCGFIHPTSGIVLADGKVIGKDVDYQAVVDAVKEHDAKLVGLSALMTTTLVSMEKTIELIHENNLDCKIMVGGAVLTPDYAKQIHADFYAKDAKESVDIAKQVLG